VNCGLLTLHPKNTIFDFLNNLISNR